MKKLFVTSSIIFIIASCFFFSYFSIPVYADDTTPDYESVTQQEAVDAFRAYCKSRNLTIDGSILDAVTSWTTDTYNKLCSSIGIDPTSLQAEIKKYTDSNGALRWFLTASGVDVLNRLFSELLQNNDLEVGQEDIDKIVYSNEWWVSAEGYGAFVYNLKKGSIGEYFVSQSDYVNTLGTPLFGYYGSDFLTYDDLSITITPSGASSVVLYSFPVTNPPMQPPTKSGVIIVVNSKGSYGGFNLGYGELRSGIIANGNFMIWRVNNSYGFGTFVNFSDGTIGLRSYSPSFTPNDTVDTDIKIVSPVIKPEPPSDEPLDIGDDGNTDTPVTPLPPGGTLPDWDTNTQITPDGDGGFNLPFSLPDLNIDWKINGLTEKFPFSIPFDLVAFYTTLNAEPEAPVIDAHIPLGDFYDWHFVADFSVFDDKARLIRSVEFIGFCIGLIYITIRLVKG